MQGRAWRGASESLREAMGLLMETQCRGGEDDLSNRCVSAVLLRCPDGLMMYHQPMSTPRACACSTGGVMETSCGIRGTPCKAIATRRVRRPRPTLGGSGARQDHRV